MILGIYKDLKMRRKSFSDVNLFAAVFAEDNKRLIGYLKAVDVLTKKIKSTKNGKKTKMIID